MRGGFGSYPMRPVPSHPVHAGERHFLLRKIPEGADRFGNWDNVEYDKSTGRTKRVQRTPSRPQRTNRRDRLVVTDPDGEGASRFGNWDRVGFDKKTGKMTRRPKKKGDEGQITDDQGEAASFLQ